MVLQEHPGIARDPVVGKTLGGGCSKNKPVRAKPEGVRGRGGMEKTLDAWEDGKKSRDAWRHLLESGLEEYINNNSSVVT